jgi:hypothetical protein
MFRLLKNVNEQKIIAFSLCYIKKNAYLCTVRSKEIVSEHDTKTFRVMNTSELIQKVANINGCRFASIEYKSEEKLPKKLGLGVVTKIVCGIVQINYSYENAVNNRLQKQGDAATFQAESLPWGQWYSVNKVINHNGQYYLRFYTVDNQKLDTTYFVDGRPATPAEIATIKAYKDSKSKPSARQAAEGLTDNQVTARSVNFDNITAFKCGDIIYEQVAKVAV